MPVEKTLDGRFINFPEGYDTLEGRDRIVESKSYSPASLRFILARGIIKELGGDDIVWKKDSNGNWMFNQHPSLVVEIAERFKLSESAVAASLVIAHPLFSELWIADHKGNSNQGELYETITIVKTSLWESAEKLANPYDEYWTEELRQKRVSYFREIVKLLCVLKGEGRSTSSEYFEERCDNFEEAFNQSYFANFVKLPDNWRDLRAVSLAIRRIAKNFKMLDKEKVQRVIEENQAQEEKLVSSLIQQIAEGENLTDVIAQLEALLGESQNRHSLLLKLRKQIGNVSPDKRPIVVERFSRDRILSEYIKELYGWKCQICGFTFEKKDGGLYAETHHLEPLSKGGHDSIENIIVVCPNHHALFEHGDVSILSVTSEKVEVLINNEHHTIKRVPHSYE